MKPSRKSELVGATLGLHPPRAGKTAIPANPTAAVPKNCRLEIPFLNCFCICLIFWLL
jgi:hypothetical protein